jgi:hypothetical protein
MRYFFFHILFKDCSWLLIYFVIMRFNLTGETFLPQMIKNFPEASKMTLVDMVITSVICNMLPIALSLVTYYFFYWIVKKIFGRTTTLSILITALLLATTTPISLIVFGKVKLLDLKATTWAFSLSFLISIAMYFLFNKNERQNIKVV